MEKERIITLVKSAQNGDAAAITELYNGYHNDIYYYIWKTMDKQDDPELAADLTQDTFIEIFQTIGNLQDPAAFITWSRKIAYHRCTAYFRKRHELLADEQEDGSTIFDTIVEDREEFIPGEALEKEDLKKTIREMIDSLPEEQRSAIMMRYFDELSVQDIAAIQSTTEGTVKSRLNYGRKAIKKAVEDYEKKHDVKLHCTGIVPVLLWLFREQRRAQAASPSASAASAGKPIATEALKNAAVSTAQKAAKFTMRKIIAAVAAVALSASAIGIGVSVVKQSEQGAQSHGNTSQASNVSAEDFCGVWIHEEDSLEIQFYTIAERYYFSYRPAAGDGYDFFAEFDPQKGVFWTPEGNACGFLDGTDPEGNLITDWRDTDNPPWTFTCQENTLYWKRGEDLTYVFHRSGAEGETGSDSPRYNLEDYPVYTQKVAQYRSAIFCDPQAYNKAQYPTLNTSVLDEYHWYSQDVSFFYALVDIDSNGTPELLIGTGDARSPSIIDLYSICEDAIVQYFGNPNFGYGQRTYLSILADGMLSYGGSSGGSSGGTTIFQISEDGGSISQIADYQYYIPDEYLPAPEGEYMSFEEYQAATSQYKAYPGQIRWSPMEQ